MEALSHRRAEVVDMGPVPGNDGRTRLSLTCPSRFDYPLNINSVFLPLSLLVCCANIMRSYHLTK